MRKPLSLPFAKHLVKLGKPPKTPGRPGKSKDYRVFYVNQRKTKGNTMDMTDLLVLQVELMAFQRQQMAFQVEVLERLDRIKFNKEKDHQASRETNLRVIQNQLVALREENYKALREIQGNPQESLKAIQEIAHDFHSKRKAFYEDTIERLESIEAHFVNLCDKVDI